MSLVLALSSVAQSEATSPKEPPVLRCHDAALRLLAEQGLARSETLRALVAALQRGHLIAFVLVSHDLPFGTGGRVRFIGAGDGWRFLQIDLDDRGVKIDVGSLLGHELQHAAEIAAARDVVDSDSMATLYDRIGLHTSGPRVRDSYETQAALDTEQHVYRELLRGGWR